MGTIITKGRSFQAQVRKKGHPSITRTFDTRKAAALWITQTEADISRGLYVDRSVAENMTLKKLLIKYGKEVTPDKKSATKESYIISRLCRESIAAYSLANLPPDALAAFRDRRLEKVSPATVTRDLALISTAIEHARKNWRVNLVNNPVHLISKPKVKNERKRRLRDLEEHYLRIALTVSDYEGADYCEPRTENPYVLPAFEFAIESAMRAGDLIGICVGDDCIETPRRKRLRLTFQSLFVFNLKPRAGVLPFCPATLALQPPRVRAAPPPCASLEFERL